MRQLQSQNDLLKDEIIELKTAFDEQFLTPPPQSSNTYTQRASTMRVIVPQNSASEAAHSSPTSQLISETPYFTIDTSAVVEEDASKITPAAIRATVKTELDKSLSTEKVDLRAIIRDPQNIKRYRLLFRTEEDRDLARGNINWARYVAGVRVLQDRHFPLKIDNAIRPSILDSEGGLVYDVKDKLGKENSVTIPHMRWISNKHNGKLNGSMVIWVTKKADAERLMRRWFLPHIIYAIECL